MTHLSQEALVAWRDQPDETSRAAIVGHLAACNECAALYAELIRARPLTSAPQRFDPAEFRQRGLSIRTGASAASRFPRWTWAALAAAAAIVLAVVVPRWSAEPEAPVSRGAAGLQALAPSGPVGRVGEFTWNAPPAADSFLLEISDSSGRVVHEARVRGQRSYTVPADVAAVLQPGTTYRWLVSRLDARGDIVESSAMTEFRVTR